jgi:hypothetical protein
MMPEMEVFSDLIGTIYDTTLDSGLWYDALRKSAEFVGGSASSLYWKDAVHGTGKPIRYWIARPDNTIPSYFDECVSVDPLTARQFLFDVGEIYSIEDCMPYAEFMESRLYKEWIRPNGYVEQLAATVDKSATGFSLFAIFRGEEQGLVDAEARRRMGLIVPHVRRAVLIGSALELDTATAFADTLSGLAAGVFLVDKNSRIVFANTSGQIMLEDERILRQKDDVLTAVNPIGTPLPEIIALAGDADAAVGAMSLALSAPPEPWLAHLGDQAGGRNGLFRRGGGVRSKGLDRYIVSPGDHVRILPADAGRTARAHGAEPG